MKGPANEGMAMNKARIGPGFLQPTAGAATGQKVPPGRVVSTHSLPGTAQEAAKKL